MKNRPVVTLGSVAWFVVGLVLLAGGFVRALYLRVHGALGSRS